ncbi:MAG: SEC-C metal-binding domain-containing protein [Thiobacillus sp.]|nr:SEC-C metal-binding domain-containing protein [Thiobacillus sp.]MDP2254172.1 SEC-C metal-binding domain-containing protein [Thiobacillus sp.]MDP2979068.1 SEC-C metal-binding domain-containing protein [Thiobacillus sp.]
MNTISRNEPCPCGSGKRYKHCCGVVGLAVPEQALSRPTPQPADPLSDLMQQALRQKTEAALRRINPVAAKGLGSVVPGVRRGPFIENVQL